MSLYTREARDLGSQDVWGDDYVSPLGQSGVTRIGAVYAAVSLIADLFSIVPVSTVQERSPGEFDPVASRPIVADPDPILPPSAWRWQMVASLKLRGNAYGIVDPDRRYMRWLHPDWVQIDESNPLSPVYTVHGREVQLVKRGGSLVHLREFITPGTVKGISPIQHFMDLFEGANLAAAYGRKWFKNASIPPAIISTTTPRLGADVLREARDDFIEAAKDGKPVALPGEWSWQKISIAPNEAQFLEAIEATATTIAAIYRVPAEDIGGKAGSSRTYSNREMDQELLNIRTLMPIGVRMSEVYHDILPAGQAIRLDYDVLAQPGQLEMARADSEELRNGTLTLPEARRRRGRKPLTDREIEAWQDHYTTQKTQSESIAEAITKEAP